MRNISILLVLFIANLPINSFADSNKEELRVTLQSSVIVLDPGGVQDSQSQFVSRQVNCQLVRNQGSTFVLDAAESIKYITPLQIVLKLKNQARFHDGTLIKAEDVLASLEYIKDSRNIFKNMFIWIKSIEIKDQSTIIFYFEKHVPQFLKVLSSKNFAIFKKSFLEDAKKDKNLWKAPLGCGGYKVAKFDDEKIELMPISHGLPITFYLIKANQIDVSEVSKYDIITLNVVGSSDELKDFDLLEMFDPIQYFVGLNTKSNKWKNKEDRCNFLSQLDLKDLLASYGKNAIEADDLLPKGTLGYRANNSCYHLTAGSDSKAITPIRDKQTEPFCLAYLTVSIQEQNKNKFVDMFKSQFPNIVMKPIENVKKFGKSFVETKCDALVFALRTTYFDGYEFLTIFEDNDANFTGSENKKLDEHILKSQLISNPNERAKEYQKITKEIEELCIVRPLLTLPNRRVYVRKNLKTPEIGLISILQYYLGNISRS